VDHRNGTIYRFIPRENPAVNKVWMCDSGRLSYKRNNSGRSLEPAILKGMEQTPVSWEDAYKLFMSRAQEARKQSGGGACAALVSARATNEELFLVHKLATEVLEAGFIDYRVEEQDPSETEDRVLRRKDHYPNSTGASALNVASGAGSGITEMLRSARDGKIKFLYIVGGDIVTRYPNKDLLTAALRSVACVVMQVSFSDEIIDGTDLVLPQGTYLETNGTFTNYEGRVQRIHPAAPPPGSAREGWRILTDLLELSGAGTGISSSEEAFGLLTQERKAFAGLSYASVGEQGSLLDGRLL
jgi:predicted molibdopterin-dependent oxidoreductase YjgC